MAGFKTHITVSSVVGLGYGAGAYLLYDVPGTACILAGGLCGVSGMLPDIDSGPGRPLRESLAFAAAVVSTMLVDRFQQFGLSMEGIVLAGAAVYGLIRFGLAELLQRWTVHRGMFHSIPAAIVFGELAFLLSCGETGLRWYKAGAVVLGYLSHLVLDELYSIQWIRGRWTFKKSFGTALKVVGRQWWPNVSVYAKLLLFTFLVVKEPGWMEEVARPRLQQASEEWTQTFMEYLDYMNETDDVEPAGPQNREEKAPGMREDKAIARPAAVAGFSDPFPHIPTPTRR